MLIEIANKILSVGVIIIQATFIVAFLGLIFYQPKKESELARFLVKKGIILAFIIALAATLGSLFYSEIAGYAPCDLCWYQRIFMYPQVIILGIALLYKDLGVIKYSLPLALGGLLFSIYHNYLIFSGSTLSVCTISTFTGVSCLQRYVFEFGYITIPLMSFSAFALITLILFWIRKVDK
jgi:disulfide bond formation protein DsbB